MATLIQRIGKLAVNTFRRETISKSVGNNFKANFEQLQTLLNGVTASELQLDPSLLNDTGPFNVS